MTPVSLSTCAVCVTSPPGDDRDDRQAELRGELEVALVVAGHGHDRAGAVAA